MGSRGEKILDPALAAMEAMAKMNKEELGPIILERERVGRIIKAPKRRSEGRLKLAMAKARNLQKLVDTHKILPEWRGNILVFEIPGGHQRQIELPRGLGAEELVL